MMIRSAVRFAITLSLGSFLAGASQAEDITSALGYRANIKESWKFFEVKETRKNGLHEEVKKEIEKLGKSANEESLSSAFHKVSNDDFELIGLGPEGDNINIRIARGVMPSIGRDATLQKETLQVLLQEMLKSPVTMNSSDMVKLPNSNHWAFIMDFHVTMKGVRTHQVQYMVGSHPGKELAFLVAGTFFTSSDRSHRLVMEDFMKSFEVKPKIDGKNAEFRVNIQSAKSRIGL